VGAGNGDRREHVFLARIAGRHLGTFEIEGLHDFEGGNPGHDDLRI